MLICAKMVNYRLLVRAKPVYMIHYQCYQQEAVWRFASPLGLTLRTNFGLLPHSAEWSYMEQKQRLPVSFFLLFYRRPYLFTGTLPGTCNRFVGARPGSATPVVGERHWFSDPWTRCQSQGLQESRTSGCRQSEGVWGPRASDVCSQWPTTRGRSGFGR